MVILGLCLGVFKFPGQMSERLAVELSMNADEQEMVIPALASILDKQKFPDHVKNGILTSGDWFGLALGGGMYAMRVYGVLTQVRREFHEYVTGVQSAQTVASQSNGHNNGNGGGFPFNQFQPVGAENRGL